MKHNPNYKPEIKIRELPPKLNQDKAKPQVLCPFCEIPHPLDFGADAACGTLLKVTAIQTIYPARTVKKHEMVCFKCHKSGGEMVRFNSAFIHLQECSPDTKLMAAPPEFSRLARAVYLMHPAVRKVLEKQYGLAKQVQEVDEHGKSTGKVLGYFFYKGVT